MLFDEFFVLIEVLLFILFFKLFFYSSCFNLIFYFMCEKLIYMFGVVSILIKVEICMVRLYGFWWFSIFVGGWRIWRNNLL